MSRARPREQEGRPIPASLGAHVPRLKSKVTTVPLWALSRSPSHQPSIFWPRLLAVSGGSVAGAGRRVPRVLAGSS